MSAIGRSNAPARTQLLHAAAGGRASFGEDFLLDRFRTFYAEVLQVMDDLGALDNVAGGAAALNSDTPGLATQRLAQHLERDAVHAQRIGGVLGARMFQDAQYLMAALADEIILHNSPWRGRDKWKSSLVEAKLFRTSQAGDLVFERIEDLLRRRDPLDEPLAVLYLLALRAGYQGRYRGAPEGPALLDDYRRRLFQFVANRHPDVEKPQGGAFFADAYDHTMERQRTETLPYVWRWIFGTVVVLVVFVLGSHLAWRSVTEPVRTVLEATSQ